MRSAAPPSQQGIQAGSSHRDCSTVAEVLHDIVAPVNVKGLTTLHGKISWQHVQVALQLGESWALLKSLVVAAEPLLHLQVHHHVLSCIFQHTYHRSVASGGMLTGAPVSCLILSADPPSCCIPPAFYAAEVSPPICTSNGEHLATHH